MTGKRVAIRTDDGECPCQIFTPEGPARQLPAIILYMDAAGIRPALGEMSQRLADAGFVVLLPDLFYRYGSYGPLVPKKLFAGDFRAVLGPLMATTDTARAAADTGAFLRYLDTRDDVAGCHLGAVGFYLGGGLTIASAATWPRRFAAVASFHGGFLATDEPTSPHLFAPAIEGELYVAAAMNDPTYPAAMAERFEATLDAADVRYRAQIYPACHGWMNLDGTAYDAAQAERGWSAMIDLFERTLGSP